MLHRRLKRICTAELRVYHYQLYGPVYRDCESDEEDDARDHACLPKCIWLSDDACAARIAVSISLPRSISISYMMLFAIFMNAERMPLFGLALSSRSSALKSESSLASVTDGASMFSSRGMR